MTGKMTEAGIRAQRIRTGSGRSLGGKRPPSFEALGPSGPLPAAPTTAHLPAGVPRHPPDAAESPRGEGRKARLLQCKEPAPSVKLKRALSTREVGGDVLSHRWTGSTIRATGLNGRVREGNGCFPRAMATNHHSATDRGASLRWASSGSLRRSMSTTPHSPSSPALRCIHAEQPTDRAGAARAAEKEHREERRVPDVGRLGGAGCSRVQLG